MNLDSVGFFADIVQTIEDLPTYAFVKVEIKHKQPNEKAKMSNDPVGKWWQVSRLRRHKVKTQANNERLRNSVDLKRAELENVRSTTTDVEQAAPSMGIPRKRTIHEKVAEYLTAQGKRPAVPVRLFSPLHILTVFSFLVSVGLLVAASYWKDGPAIIAVSIIVRRSEP